MSIIDNHRQLKQLIQEYCFRGIRPDRLFRIFVLLQKRMQPEDIVSNPYFWYRLFDVDQESRLRVSMRIQETTWLSLAVVIESNRDHLFLVFKRIRLGLAPGIDYLQIQVSKDCRVIEHEFYTEEQIFQRFGCCEI